MRKTKQQLWKIILIALLVVSIVLVLEIMNRKATKEFHNALTDSAITFSELDYHNYVSKDIKLRDMVEIKGNEYEIEWSSNKPEYITNVGEVTRPDEKNKTVRLTAKINHRLGVAKKEYDLTVVKNGNNLDTIDQLTLTNVDNVDNLLITYDINGNIDEIEGNSLHIKAQSVDDVNKVVEKLYKVFQIENIYHFECISIQDSLVGRVFTFEQQFNGTVIGDYFLSIHTDENDNIICITSDLYRGDVEEVKKISKLSEKEIEEIVISAYGNDYVVKSITRNANRKKGICSVLLAYKNDLLHKNTMMAFVNETTGEITDTMSFLEGKLEMEYNSLGIRKKNNISVFDVSDYDEEIKRLNNIFAWTTNGTVGLKNKIHDDFSELLLNIKENGENDITYQSVKNTYDWFEKKLGRVSIDNKGKEIVILTNSSTVKDNASYLQVGDLFLFGKQEHYNYPLNENSDIVAHEYSHAVFNHITNSFVPISLMARSIDEGYADIFSCLINKNWVVAEDLKDGKAMRNISDEDIEVYQDHKYPETYLDENWSEYLPHINGTLLTRVAYEMEKAGFTTDDIARIWYQSMFYGYSNRSDFITVMNNVMKAARALNYSEKEQEKIENVFDNLRIQK